MLLWLIGLILSYALLEWYNDKHEHYSDVIMNAIASPITGVAIVYSTFVQAQIRENIKAPRHWPLWGEFAGDRWIPRKKGQ